MHTNSHTLRIISLTIRTPQEGSSIRCHHLTACNPPFNFQWKVVKLLLCGMEFVGQYEQTSGKELIIYIKNLSIFQRAK